MYAKSAIILIIIAIFIGAAALTAFAAADNTINAGNPSGCQSDVCKQFTAFKGDLLGFLRWLFPIGIATAGALSVIMLIFAGFQWMAGAISPPQIEAAKSRITAALSGLFLALISWLVLYTINPDLVTLRRPGASLELQCPNGVCPKLEDALFGVYSPKTIPLRTTTDIPLTKEEQSTIEKSGDVLLEEIPILTITQPAGNAAMTQETASKVRQYGEKCSAAGGKIGFVTTSVCKINNEIKPIDPTKPCLNQGGELLRSVKYSCVKKQ